jgi:hypothetical protein
MLISFRACSTESVKEFDTNEAIIGQMPGLQLLTCHLLDCKDFRRFQASPTTGPDRAPSRLKRLAISCYYTIMNRAAFIEKLTEVQQTVGQLLAELQASEQDKFAAHLYQARREFRHISDRPNKGNKAIEREVIASFQIAQSLGFKGDFRQWEHLLRIHE